MARYPRTAAARLLREDLRCGGIDSRKGTLMARWADSYCSRCLRCVPSAAFLVVLSIVGCGGLDTQDVDVMRFETSFASDGWEGCDDSPTADPPHENSPDPNEAEVCGC